jgi:hypothetical protein
VIRQFLNLDNLNEVRSFVSSYYWSSVHQKLVRLPDSDEPFLPLIEMESFAGLSDCVTKDNRKPISFRIGGIDELERNAHATYVKLLPIVITSADLTPSLVIRAWGSEANSIPSGNLTPIASVSPCTNVTRVSVLL